MPVTLCAARGCGELAAPGQNRCPEHAAEQREQSRSANRKFYDRKHWRTVRKYHLFHTPLCERCGVIAEHVHHDPPLSQLLATGGNPYDPKVLHSLCASCHGATHARQSWGGERL